MEKVAIAHLEISQYLSQLGKKGAAKTNGQLTPEQRKRKAQKAARVRWAKEAAKRKPTAAEIEAGKKLQPLAEQTLARWSKKKTEK